MHLPYPSIRQTDTNYHSRSLHKWTLTGGWHEKRSALCIPRRRTFFRQRYTIEKAQFIYVRFSFLGTSFAFYSHQSLHMISLHFGLEEEVNKMFVYVCCIQFEGKIYLLSSTCTILGYHSKMESKRRNRRDWDMTKKI